MSIINDALKKIQNDRIEKKIESGHLLTPSYPQSVSFSSEYTRAIIRAIFRTHLPAICIILFGGLLTRSIWQINPATLPSAPPAANAMHFSSVVPKIQSTYLPTKKTIMSFEAAALLESLDLHLNGIIFYPNESPIAIINNKVLATGDYIPWDPRKIYQKKKKSTLAIKVNFLF